MSTYRIFKTTLSNSNRAARHSKLTSGLLVASMIAGMSFAPRAEADGGAGLAIGLFVAGLAAAEVEKQADDCIAAVSHKIVGEHCPIVEETEHDYGYWTASLFQKGENPGFCERARRRAWARRPG
jgi:hypothetical protein